jgi:uncharacterized protein VirK/YbjX
VSTWVIFDADAGPLAAFGDRGLRRFWLRSLLAPRVAWSWRDHALSFYRRHGAAIPNARVLSKPLHGYLRRGLNPATRLSALVEHYRLLGTHIELDRLRAFCAGEPIELVRLQGRRDTTFCLFLINATMVQTQREGECTLCLVREGSATLLSRLTFNFFVVDGRPALAVGGLQGPKAGGKREVIDATRDLYGLRPKDATLLAARAIANGLDAAVHAVGDALHVHRTLQDHVKHSSYDAYWHERGATTGGPFGFVLPLLEALPPPSTRRDMAKIAIVEASRRLLAARRHSL